MPHPRPPLDERWAGFAALQTGLPSSAAFSHLTAAALHGWWLPPLPRGLPYCLAMCVDEPRPRRRGMRVTRHPAPPGRVRLDGLWVTAPAETLLGCAADLGLLDLVALADSALHLDSCSRADLDEGLLGDVEVRRPCAVP